MSEYDEPPEPTQAEIDENDTRQAVLHEPTVRIEGLTPAAVSAIVRSAVEAVVRGDWNLAERVEKAIDAAIAEKISEIAHEQIRVRVDALIDKLLEEGIPEFDRHSGRELAREMLPELLQKQLTVKYSEAGFGYGHQTHTAAEHAVMRAVTKLFDKTLEAQLVAIKADFKKQADEVFKAKLVAGMREALGLRS